MVLGDLIKSMWESTEEPEQTQGAVAFPQGAQFLEYQRMKTQRLQRRTAMLTDANGYDLNHTYAGQAALRSAAAESMSQNQTLVEGFEGMAGPTAANARNALDLAAVTATEDRFNQKLSNYATAHKSLMDKTQRFVTTTAQGNKYANQNIRLGDGAIGYVNDRGFFRWYGNMDIVNQTIGKNGCPADIANVSVLPVNPSDVRTPGATIPTDPPLFVAEPMRAGQPCGSAGKNLQVGAVSGPEAPANFAGCYASGSDAQTGLDYQTDMGRLATYEGCKTRAYDLGKSAFTLRDGGEGSSMCYVGSSVDSAKSAGLATRNIVSYNVVSGTSPGASATSGGVLRNGTIGIMNGSQVVASSGPTAIDGCDPFSGASVNTSNTVASYGLNCNSAIAPPS